MNPLLRHTAWHVPRPLDLRAMRSAAPLFLGRHDFQSFAANRNYEMESTVRRLSRCDFRKNGPLLTFVIEGEGFLYKMCRGIVGTLVQVGQGKFPPDEIKRRLYEVKASEIRKAARDFLRADRVTATVVSSLSKTNGLAKSLQALP